MMKICHKIGLSVIAILTIFIKVLTSKMSLLYVKNVE